MVCDEKGREQIAGVSEELHAAGGTWNPTLQKTKAAGATVVELRL